MIFIKKFLLVYYYKLKVYKNDMCRKFLRNIRIRNSWDTVEYIVEAKCSISRFGDGEFYAVGGDGNPFQKSDANLTRVLREILTSPIPNHIIGLPYSYVDTKPYVFNSKLFTYGWLAANLEKCVIPYVSLDTTYYDSLFTRFYMSKKNKDCDAYIKHLKKIWEKREVCIVEGVYTRLGVGNDLFDNAASIIRVLCPSKNAFDMYDEIVSAVSKYGHGKLVLIALGMTATVLAYDLAKRGEQAIDIGHIDIEYEWYKIGAKTKVLLKNKNTDEVPGDTSHDSFHDDMYESQVVFKVL
ncbi:GT-D fold domain-containing glycosyltransferase [Prevotella sp. kh1p2]|uniref:GT-D fold domain-containing glycosyltransferase n=1 Tax=Prevotella sp. kh1p2 TaxID=1761883 RepID=UPI0008AB4AF3|nr:GT-D fold domain-containing glycosyltransferase [Prevotella sp. kh1p2]SET10793.1 glycosyltransferase, SP_1767 family [Prevotella sp. kh1p2]SNU11841.1 glycosyltransferase, SP_1767 family [Prevotellaceae bacterium KH2P17]